MKNKIKSPKQDSLRGIGKLGWTETSKNISTLRNLISSFSEGKLPKKKRNKIKVKCSKCRSTFKTVNGKIPRHYVREYSFKDFWKT